MAVKSALSLFVFVLTLISAGGAHARTQLAWPVVCTPGVSCFILSYPDLDGRAGSAKDYACGPQAQDGDMALRIGLPSSAAILTNIPVLAVADGKVVDAGDGRIKDMIITGRAQLKTGTPLCGNGIVIDHGAGLQSAYCHLKAGSLLVKKGMQVKKGQVIAFVGQSGLTLWPQLAFSLRKGGYFVDPITGDTSIEGCGGHVSAMMDLPDAFKAYQAVAIPSLGFSIEAQSADNVAIGKGARYATINKAAPSINMWSMVLGLKKGDEVETILRDGRGRAFERRKITMDQDKDRQLINITRPRGFAYWREGVYSGQIIVRRTLEGAREEVASRSVSVEIR